MDNKTIEQIDGTICSGCGLCVQKCPKKCISMVENNEGFFFPTVDHSICINCGVCLNMCSATDASNKLYNKYDSSYICATIADKEKLLKSSSGGMFGVLAEYILGIGGFVCGCVYNSDMEAIHVLSNERAEVEKMYGSKYVQSRIEHCFKEIYDLLESDVPVMFTGTACQIAAIRLFLGKEYTGLYCVEILCHGVPSPGLFRLYKNYLEKKLVGKIKDIRFRDKRKSGWGSEHRTCVIYEKRGKYKEFRPVLPSYFSAFFYGLNLRESCYKCRFAKINRISDVTIGDFWGSWAKYGKRFTEGISVVALNTEKGKHLVSKIENQFEFCDILTQDEATKSNDNFEHPIKRPLERDSFYEKIGTKGYKGLWKKVYFTKSYKKKTLASIYGAFVPAKIRFAIQKVKRKRNF